MMKKIILSSFSILFCLASQAEMPNINYSTPQTFKVGSAVKQVNPVNSGGKVILSKVSTFVEKNTENWVDTTGFLPKYRFPNGIAIDTTGTIYVADWVDNIIRKISVNGKVSKLAGTGKAGWKDTINAIAQFNSPTNIAVNDSGDVFVADYQNNRIRKIAKNGQVSTVAGSGVKGSKDGEALYATFNLPYDLVFDKKGNLYVSDMANHKIRKITQDGQVLTLAGSSSGMANGKGSQAQFHYPRGLAVDSLGNVYVADSENSVIRKITPEGVASTFAGCGSSPDFVDGQALLASFRYPTGLEFGPDGSLYIADTANRRLRKLSPNGMVSTLAGSSTSGSFDGIGKEASFGELTSVAIDKSGQIFLSDLVGQSIRKVVEFGYKVKPTLPSGLFLDPETGQISGTPKDACDTTEYAITASNIDGASTTILKIVISPRSGIDNKLESTVVVYPNPVTDKLQIENSPINTLIELFNIQGQPVFSTVSKTSHLTLDLTKLSSGVYMVKLKGENLEKVVLVLKK